MESIETLTQEILDKLSELEVLSSKLSSLTPVSHLSKSKIRWYGGIIGTVQEIRENKRLEKLMNEPLVEGKSFFVIALSVIPEAANYLVERQLKVQQLVGKEDSRYFGLVVDIFNGIEKAICSWYNYSPDMAEASITIGDEKNVALYPSVREFTADYIKKLDLSQNIKDRYEEQKDQQSDSSGCLGSFVILIAASVATLSGSVYGLYQFVM